MVKDCIKLKRGMVFTYNIDPEVDKFNIPKIKLSNGKEIDDHLQYGFRDFLVISNDYNNCYSPTCNIIPITSSITKNDIPTHVQFNYLGKDLMVMCEHVYTVNSKELFKYVYTLSDEVMDKVDDALCTQLGISKSSQDKSIRMSLDKVEAIIQGIINKSIEDIVEPRKASDVDIEDAVTRLGEGLQRMLESKINNPKQDMVSAVAPVMKVDEVNRNGRVYKSKDTKPKSQIDKFYSKYPNLDKNKTNGDVTIVKGDKVVSSTKKPRRSWTRESMQDFMDDANKLSPTDMVKKYSFEDVNEFYKVRYYVQNRLSGRL